ncbi:hypothetical protein L2E82_09154 [Cichorium intybus]|uniref:Uncharacterized protein n=1 Tax=Cichorium intybus TaxID=13427 RepID=A0ACB9G8Q7_CICIN|nr:hypothetical protein L2E82_09154 [Cichorium intybus]
MASASNTLSIARYIFRVASIAVKVLLLLQKACGDTEDRDKASEDDLKSGSRDSIRSYIGCQLSEHKEVAGFDMPNSCRHDKGKDA